MVMNTVSRPADAGAASPSPSPCGSLCSVGAGAWGSAGKSGIP